MILLFSFFIFFAGQFSPGAASRFVLRNTNVVDVNDGKLVVNVDVLIEGKFIKGIESHHPEIPYGDVPVIGGEGLYCIPGLIDAHTHVSNAPEKSLALALKKGVTAIRDMGGDGQYLQELQQAVRKGELPGPDIYFSAVMGGKEFIMNDSRVRLSTPIRFPLGEAPWARLVTEESNIAEIIKDAKACGATGIKMYAQLTADLVVKLTKEAKANHLKVWSHGVIYPAMLEDVIDAGVDAVSHVNSLLLRPDWNLKRDGSLAIDAPLLHSARLARILDSMVAKGIYLDPTLSVMKYMTRSISDKKKAGEIEASLFKATHLAYRKGVKIVTGTDSPLPRSENDRLFLYDEISMLVCDAGFSPLDAIRAATIHGAEILGITQSHGSLSAGKVADILVLKANPLEHIGNIEKVEFVIKNGRMQ